MGILPSYLILGWSVTLPDMRKLDNNIKDNRYCTMQTVNKYENLPAIRPIIIGTIDID